jgi:hypothetical protein
MRLAQVERLHFAYCRKLLERQLHGLRTGSKRYRVKLLAPSQFCR